MPSCEGQDHHVHMTMTANSVFESLTLNGRDITVTMGIKKRKAPKCTAALVLKRYTNTS